jgi:hypothetical protein
LRAEVGGTLQHRPELLIDVLEGFTPGAHQLSSTVMGDPRSIELRQVISL